MKFYNFILIGVASLVFWACSSSEETGSPVTEASSISVTLGGIKTKSSQDTGIFTKDTMNVNSVLINLVDGSGNVVASKNVTKSDVVNSDWDKLTDSSKGLKFINITPAVSKVYVYGNPKSAVSGNTVSTKLGEQQGSEVLYYGLDEDLTPVVPEPIDPDPTTGQTYTAQVTIAPVVARLQIKSVNFVDTGSFVFTRSISNVERSATVHWDGFTADLRGIYLNNFYNTYHGPKNLDDLAKNTTFQNQITGGYWFFNLTPNIDASDYASYTNFNGTDYQNLPALASNQCYAFNFFPGLEVPTLHLDFANINVENMTSTDDEVFNPELAENERFANIVKFYKDGGKIEMTADDFKPGTLYNMEINVIPMLDNDLGNVQYNVLVLVTVAEWSEETIIPGFDLNQ